MTETRRRGLIMGLMTVAALSFGACAAPAPESTFEPAPRLSPAPRDSYLALGARLLEANEPALAMRAFTASLTLEGISPEALTGAGIAAQRQGMLGAARHHLEYARTLAPNSAAAYQNLAMVLMMLKDYHGARTAFGSALLLSGDESNGTASKGLERAELAIAALESGRHPDPAATQRVVRLGTDMFRLAERTDVGTDAGAGPGEPVEPPERASAETEAALAAAGASGGAGGEGRGDKTGPELAAAAANGPGNRPGARAETEAGTGIAALAAGEVEVEAD